ncbi:hypothetical protein SAMN05421805_102133 [Saccharopolyspora antimicrobica]|uniref:Uncharacterized protein n=1 Tax=Saccharopolyspora antimicrobica TaxID=455193 RepID=A0A1I4VD94_9PSEU|nr:hypothetical protein ATL45_4599 [Saccharopolyspora antimicrobica]SFM99060.1 hypothetical protein SAMN05421805_102133 [Saccharopolyspora antimicrobica]
MRPHHLLAVVEIRFANNEAAKGWEELCRAARSNTWEAWVVLSERPLDPVNPGRQHPMKKPLAAHVVFGKELDQWQYEVTSSGRIWYCPDPDKRVVWILRASPEHPKWTD